MKVAVIADIHGNWEALKQVARHIAQNHKDSEIWCLGDVIGYGPNPRTCLFYVRNACKKYIKGNHEDAVADKTKEIEMNRYAIEGIRFSRKMLTQKDLDFIAALPTCEVVKEYDVTLCHGAYTEPQIWTYVDSPLKARKELEHIPTRICLVGHTHNPFVFGEKKGLYRNIPDNMELNADEKYIINVGSVGQPRDGDCRACYATLDFQENNKVIFDLHRVFYDIQKTDDALAKNNLPSFLGERLYRGE